jgi:hypothetical protein
MVLLVLLVFYCFKHSKPPVRVVMALAPGALYALSVHSGAGPPKLFNVTAGSKAAPLQRALRPTAPK